jgi:hypothetical protein
MIIPLLVCKRSVKAALFRQQILEPGSADNAVRVWWVDGISVCELQLTALDCCARVSAPDVRT